MFASDRIEDNARALLYLNTITRGYCKKIYTPTYTWTHTNTRALYMRPNQWYFRSPNNKYVCILRTQSRVLSHIVLTIHSSPLGGSIPSMVTHTLEYASLCNDVSITHSTNFEIKKRKKQIDKHDNDSFYGNSRFQVRKSTLEIHLKVGQI